MELKRDTCTVRSWRAEDDEAVARHADNRRIWRNLRDAFPHPYALAHAQDFLAKVAAQNPETFFCIAVQGEAVGSIGFVLNKDVARFTAEIGYWLSEEHWDRGIVTDALIALTHHTMTTHHLQRIYATPYAWNPASARVLEKAGYLLEARLHCAAYKDGQVVDQLLYAFTVSERSA